MEGMHWMLLLIIKRIGKCYECMQRGESTSLKSYSYVNMIAIKIGQNKILGVWLMQNQWNLYKKESVTFTQKEEITGQHKERYQAISQGVKF